jgi:hypothetical protein
MQLPDTWAESTLIDSTEGSGSCTFDLPTDRGTLCVIAARSITITQAIDTKGNRPIVFLAQGDLLMTAGGVLDLIDGAGSNDGICPGTQRGTDDSQFASGGAGGSFDTLGAPGGRSGGGSVLSGQPTQVPQPSTLRGGCRGGRGGDLTTQPSSGGAGGTSGGAVYLIAGGTLTIQGTINASGTGGGGGGLRAGGGGGGSGGYLGLDAPRVVLESAKLLANGGGGGGGANATTMGTKGGTANPASSFPYEASGGGGGASAGGDGGHGAESGSGAAPGMDTGSNGAGGGGGGGGGYIRIFSGDIQRTGADITPAAVENQN